MGDEPRQPSTILLVWLLAWSATQVAAAQTEQEVQTATAQARQWVGWPAQEECLGAFQPVADIRCRVYEIPRPLRVWVATVDLAAPGVRFATTDPAALAGDAAEFETLCNSTVEFARQRGVQLAINTSAFRPYRDRAGQPMDVVGLAAVRGRPYSRPDERFGAMYVSRHGRIALQGPPLPNDELWDVIPGFRMLLDDERIVVDPEVAASDFGDVNPRTAVGVDRGGCRLWIVVADGRQPGVSMGITLVELACLFQALGAWDALNLDGGGSTTFVLERDDGAHEVINAPVGRGAPHTLRQVANNLGIYLPGPKLAARNKKPETLRDAVMRLAGARRGGGYRWAGDGVSKDIKYDGGTVLRASSEGSYCCGATLEIFLDAYCHVRHGTSLSHMTGCWFENWPQERFISLQQGWYGTKGAAQSTLFPDSMRRTVREKQVADVLVWAGLGQTVADYRQLERGDFVQFWRPSGSGHSAVFWSRDYDEDGRERLWYWSSQAKPRHAYPAEPGGQPELTPGCGVNWEYVGDEIDPARLYGVRLIEPERPSTPATSNPARE